jgi:predicted ATPase
MLKQFRVQNFKNLVDVHFEPQLLNAVIGPNNSGKTSLLQSIDFMRAFFMSSYEVYLEEKGWSLDELPNLRQTNKEMRWDIVADFGYGSSHAGGKYEYSINLSSDKYLGIGDEKLIYTAPGKRSEVLLKREDKKVEVLNRKTGKRERTSYRVPASIISTFDPAEDQDTYPELLFFRSWVERFRYFSLQPGAIRKHVRGGKKDVSSSGENLAAALALLKNNEPEKFESLMRRIRRLFPSISDITVTKTLPRGEYSISLHEAKSSSDVIFSSSQMSEGILRLLALTSFLYFESSASILLFEEPEVSLHPQLVREVVHILRELTLRKSPNTSQVVFTTHSPYILDEFYDHPEEVFIIERSNPQEGARLIPLENVKQLSEVKNVFPESLGEAWFSGLLGGKAGVKPI